MAVDNDNIWVYDLETYPNVFTFCIVRADGKFLKVFEVSDRKNESEGILNCLRYLRSNNQKMVGFNNIGFDYPILHEMMQWAIKAKRRNQDCVYDVKNIYDLAQKQIASFKGEGFGNTIRDKDVLIEQIDLFRVHHFNNKAKSTSLKMLEFNMRSENIEDLPFEVDTSLTDEEKDVLIEYNKHDVLETLKFYKETIPALEFRAQLTEQLGKDFTNANDTKIGKDFFIMQLEKSMPGSCYKQIGRRRVVQQSKRDYIDIGDCLFDYYDFKRPEFQAVLEWFKNKRITETKGVLTDIEEHELGDVAKYAELKKKRQKFWHKPTDELITEFKQQRPCGWVEEVDLKSGKFKKSYWKNWRVAENLNVVVDGFRFDFGTGGIHGSLHSTVVQSDEDNIIIDADVASMYPNIAIANRVYPEHLSDKFCDIYEQVYQRRKQYPKGTPENAVMKLALNGVYGDSNNQYSPFYDPKYTMTITINGQLSLCLLAERLMEIEGVRLIQVNTDGVTVVCPRNKREEYESVCSQWEKDVGLDLEYADYEAMYIRDVNSYIALFTNGKVKRKGAYEYEGLGWHQNQSALIIPMAAEAAMVHGKDVEEFIRSHTNKYDFMLRTKVPRNSRLVLTHEDDSEEQLQNICRYYPCEDGGKLVKIMPPLKGKTEERRLSIEKDYKVKPCNNMKDFDWNINYDYYINEVKKLILGMTN